MTSAFHTLEFEEAAKLYHSSGDRSQADTERCVALLEKVVEKDPNDHDALHLLATCEAELNHKKKAVEIWEKSARLVRSRPPLQLGWMEWMEWMEWMDGTFSLFFDREIWRPGTDWPSAFTTGMSTRRIR